MCDDNLSLDRTKFANFMKMSYKEVDKLFEFFDMDKTGTVDVYEFVCGLALLS
jgi:Ca2+-binding EF-hand superfamily protein